MPPTMEENANTEPTDRSIPPENMTKVSPAAMIANTEDWSVISNRFLTVKK